MTSIIKEVKSPIQTNKRFFSNAEPSNSLETLEYSFRLSAIYYRPELALRRARNYRKSGITATDITGTVAGTADQ
ncbi:hypothetical protein AGABI1DRAFT_114118 [Agaricus bisporus var. burnettii JB137-S8]|uniref:Uncharacterized protein n=1 Tax=Agaricus bisporus var. burnettii (strain JB137-S8 / ATCC MYA-4627 / FGSC 10392) TaxID=597362 RepID=K5WVX5_AGABU|nr:uncharacterized protein AGABI1DRAFT_114118 [Agaricus bisporus var. burnettii JB137-S8]EKM79591.1 hypothetical protein AGABI1DRAFT_114118 [Agaricus bisporus var. burnettii JB137-S8]